MALWRRSLWWNRRPGLWWSWFHTLWWWNWRPSLRWSWLHRLWWWNGRPGLRWSWFHTRWRWNWLATHWRGNRTAALLCAIGSIAGHIHDALHQGLHDAAVDQFTSLMRGQLSFHQLTDNGGDGVEFLFRPGAVHLHYHLSQLLVLNGGLCLRSLLQSHELLTQLVRVCLTADRIGLLHSGRLQP